MQSFNYHKASSAQAAAQLLGANADGKFLAGGQSLLPAMRLGLAAPSDLIDLAGAGLSGTQSDGSSITIGAMTRHAEVERNADVIAKIKGLATLAGGIGDRQVRNMGTIGGSLANNDPSACYPAAVLGLGATVMTNKRSISADDFFKGFYETALEAGEVITAVKFPIPTKSAYLKFKNPASRFALVGVFVSQSAAGVRVAVTGASSGGVFRVKAMEAALAANFSAAGIAGVKVDATGMISDLHGSAEYRAHLVNVIAQRAVAAAL
jgi:aerobic carbon-monoxide dehydrogenase medium subunit